MRSGALEDDAFNDVGNVLALVDGGFDDFENLLPLDDLHGIFFLVEKLGDEGAADAVAVVFVAVDLDAMFKGAVGRFHGAHGGLDFGGGGDQDFDEVERAETDRIHTVENETAGGGVDEVNDVMKVWLSLVKIA